MIGGYDMFTKEDAAILDKVLETRWTCRFFTDEVPSKEDVEEIIQAGIISPYASVASKEVVPFRHFYVFFKGDPRLPVIGEILKKQTAIDIENLKEEQKTNEYLRDNSESLLNMWKNGAEHGFPVFPDPPCLVVIAEWCGARRAERQSLAHMLQNMWLKATVMNYDFGIWSIFESLVNNQEFCDLFGLPAGRYGFHACVIGHHKGEVPAPHHATAEIHWM